MASLQEIANRLDVSVSLVSKVLNNRLGTTNVRPEVVERIRQAATELGYRKNKNAAALASGRQQVFAVAIHRHGSEGSGLVEAMLAGIASAARDSGQRLLVSFFNSVEEFGIAMESIHSGAVDGLVLGGVRHESLLEELLNLQAGGVPVVTILNDPLSERIPNVGIRDSDIVKCAVEHLLSLGRTRILHLGGMAGRREGYRRSLEGAGILWDESLLIGDSPSVSFQTGWASDAVGAALDHGVHFDSVCAQSDIQAIGAMHALVRRGISIPEQVAVTGVDNAPFARYALIPITSVSQRYEERGRLATEALNRLISGQQVESVWLDPKLHTRESTIGIRASARSSDIPPNGRFPND